MRLLKSLFLTVVFCFLINQGVLAEERKHRQHGAHEHGAGHLNVVIEGGTLHMELISPAVNIVGFEHMPSNRQQKDAVHKAIETLKDSGQIFTLNPDSRCKPSRVEVETNILVDHGGEGDEHGHHEEAHHEDTDHESAPKDKDDHDNEGDRHSEFHASYELSCSSPEKLKYIDVNIFSLFKGIEELNARIISQKGQSSQKLGPSSLRIEF